MKEKLTERKSFWLTAGTILGMMIAYYCPQEPAYADSAASGDKFSMCTVLTLSGQSEAVFVLDHLTGRLLGAAHSAQTGTFTQTYARNLAEDFQVVENAQYVMVPGQVQVRASGGTQPANGCIYVGELNSGLVNMYGFKYNPGARQLLLQKLIPIASFPWRGASN